MTGQQNDIIYVTNVIFSHDFLHTFLAFSDSKMQANHETCGLPNNFWEDVSEAMNGLEGDDAMALQVVIKEEDKHST